MKNLNRTDLLQIDGHPLPVPTGSPSISFEDVESSDSGADEMGVYHREVLRYGVLTASLEYAYLTNADCAYLVSLLAVLLVIAVLLVFHIPYESYYQGGALINLFLGPATACMAVTIYSQRRLLAKHWLPVLVGCTVGVVTAMGSILLLCRLFGLDRAMTMSLLPKSVTMPIATVVSQGHGGTTAITVAAVSFVSFIIAGFVQNAVVCLIIGAALMVGTLFVIRSVTGKKTA